MDPRDYITVLDGWLECMESNVHQMRIAVKTLCEKAEFGPDVKLVLPDALNINASLRYSNLFRDLIEGWTKDRNSLNKTTDTLINNIFGGPNNCNVNPELSTVGSLLHNNSMDLNQKIDEMEKSLQNQSTKGETVTNTKDSEQSDGRPTDVIAHLSKKAKIDRKPDGGGDKATKKAKGAPKKQKVRISVENLPQVMRAKKRASAKARRTSYAVRRSSIAAARRSSIAARRSSMAKRKSSIAPKSNAADAPTSNPKPFECMVYGCSYAGARKNHLATHMKRHVKDKLVDCSKCEMKFKSADSILLARHVAEHKGK